MTTIKVNGKDINIFPGNELRIKPTGEYRILNVLKGKNIELASGNIYTEAKEDPIKQPFLLKIPSRGIKTFNDFGKLPKSKKSKKENDNAGLIGLANLAVAFAPEKDFIKASSGMGEVYSELKIDDNTTVAVRFCDHNSIMWIDHKGKKIYCHNKLPDNIAKAPKKEKKVKPIEHPLPESY